MLEETLNEEYQADDSLTKLALADVNLNADPQLKSTAETNKKPATKAPAKSAKKSSPKKAKASKGSPAKKNSKQKSSGK